MSHNTLKVDFIGRQFILRNQYFRNRQQQLYKNSTNISQQSCDIEIECEREAINMGHIAVKTYLKRTRK